MRDMLSTHDRPLKQAPGRPSAKDQPPARAVRTPPARKNEPPAKKGGK
jgi:hypothetical protein